MLEVLAERWTTPDRARLLAQLSEVDASAGVLSNGYAAPLQDCCPAAERCWKALSDQRRHETLRKERGRGGNQSIFWPWIGDEYRPGGVCVVSLNLNHEDPVEWHGLAAEYAIAGKVFDRWSAGRKTVWHRSAFHWRLAAMAHAVLTSIDGAQPTTRPGLDATSAAYHRIARLQAVKCSPRGDRSHPGTTMKVQCPSRYLAEELAVLKPAVVIATGGDAARAVRALGPCATVHRGEFLRRRAVDLGVGPTVVFELPHPSAYGRRWSTGQRELVEHLRLVPLQS